MEEFTKFLKKSLLGAIFGGLAAASFGIQANVFNSLYFDNSLNMFKAADAGRTIDTSSEAKSSGYFMVGGVIKGIPQFNPVNTPTVSDDYHPPYQWNEYVKTDFANITDLGNGAADIVFTPSGNLGAIIFADLRKQNSAFKTAFSQSAASATAATAAAANVTTETLLAHLGVNQTDNFWTANTGLDIGTAAGSAISNLLASNGDFGPNMISDSRRLPAFSDKYHGAEGNFRNVAGHARAYQRHPDIDNCLLFSSDASASFVVPEPTPIALLGLGLATLALTLRRKRPKA